MEAPPSSVPAAHGFLGFSGLAPTPLAGGLPAWLMLTDGPEIITPPGPISTKLSPTLSVICAPASSTSRVPDLK